MDKATDYAEHGRSRNSLQLERNARNPPSVHRSRNTSCTVKKRLRRAKGSRVRTALKRCKSELALY